MIMNKVTIDNQTNLPFWYVLDFIRSYLHIKAEGFLMPLDATEYTFVCGTCIIETGGGFLVRGDCEL